MEQQKNRQFTLTIIFSDNEEENQLAYSKAVRAIFFNSENNESTNQNR